MFKNFQSKAAYKIINLQNMIINVTEQELKVLAGTDNKTGTSMYGLVRAAQAKGASAMGMRLSIDDLRTNMIVHVAIDGEGHYSVIRKISNESVYLADPSKGNIVLSREKFSEVFTGNVLVITDPNMQVNGTTDQTNTNQTDNTNLSESINNSTDTNSTNAQVDSSATLTSEEMQNIIGTWMHCPCIDSQCYCWGSIDWCIVGRYAWGGAQIVGGCVVIIGGCAKIITTKGAAWSDGLIAIGGGIGLIGSGAAYIHGDGC